MDCQACTAANPEGNRFCQNCGASLSLKCGQCGFDCAPNARFCGGCGASLQRDVAAVVSALGKQPAVATALGWGELKQATVLFADIVSSTEKIARLDPEEAMERLKPAVQAMCDAVERFGGTVIRTLGDGVMALFGVPKALEGHGRLACQAALYMQSAFEGHSGGLSIRVGLHSGLVASDPYAPDVGKGGGAHGMTIHLASRVIGLAEPGGICITDTCRTLLGSGCEVEPLGEHMLKGIAKPTPIFRLAGLRAIPSSSLGERVWATHFRGREYEFELLKNSLRQTEQGHARVVGIAGEPGSGKSRLCHEFGKWCREHGIPVCEVGVQLYGHATPLQPILELLRKFYFGLGDADSPESARTDIATMLDKLDGTEQEVELVCEFLGVAPAGAAAQGMSPREKHRQLLNIFWRVVRSDPDASAVILLEDLHWLDEASEEFVSTLVEAVAGTRTFVVLNYRPSYQPIWSKAGHFVQLHLPDLNRGDMDVLVAELVGHTPQLAEVRQLIAARSGGNPFFAEELSRSLLDSGLLEGAGEMRPDLAAIESAMPVTVQAVIAARIDSLGEPEKTLLQMCAIIGKDIPLAVLENVASPLAAVIDRGLAGLCRAGLIVQQSLGGRRHFTFRHPLIQEVAYSAQLRVRRQVLHAAVAQSMEAYYRSQPDEYAGLIAYHYESAKRPVEAATHLARAARWVGSTTPSRAIKLWHKVRRLLETEPNSRAVDSLRALAGGRIVYLGWREGIGLDEVDAIMQDAMARASEADTRLIQLLLFAHGRILQSSGGPADGFVASLQRALAMGDADEGRKATLHLALSHAYAWAGLMREGLAANDVALAGLERIDSFDREFIGFSVEQWAYAIRVRLLDRLGRFGEAQEYLWKMSQLSDATGDPIMRQISHHAVVDLAWCKGEPRLALHHSQEVVAVAQENDTPYARIFAGYCLGLAQLTAGRPADARSQFEPALGMTRAQKVAVDFEAEILAGLAECELQLQNVPAALRHAREAIGLSLARSNRISELRAQTVLAEALVQAEGEEPRQAQQALARAQALLDETGAQAFAARVAAARSAVNVAA